MKEDKIVKPPNPPLRQKLNVQPPGASNWLNLLIYGEPGVGKTYLAGTAQDHPMTSPVLLLDVEGGTTTLRSRKDLDVVQVRSIQQIVDIHRELRTENAGYYKTVIIDSLTELQSLDMRDIMRETVQKRPDLDPDVPSMREYGKSREHIIRIVRGYRDLDMNTLFTALVLQDKDETGYVTMQPQLTGKTRQEIPGFLDVVGWLQSKSEDDEIVRILQFEKTRKVVAKDRTQALGASMRNPTIPEMWDLIHPGTATTKAA